MNGCRSSKHSILLQCNMGRADSAVPALRDAASMDRLARPANALAKFACATAILFMASALTVPAVAADGQADWPMRLRADLSRLGALEWQLREAAGSTCPTQVADAGLTIDDRRAYQKRDWPLLAKALGMGEAPVIAGVAPGSPAHRAGLREGDEIHAIDAEHVDTIIRRRNATALAADALLDEIAAARPGQALAFSVRRRGQAMSLTVKPVHHCGARLVLFTDRSIEAHSDNRNVAISTGMLAFARNDDELALAAGHELAHVINGDRRGGSMSARRRMEDEADALGVQLLRCAGYDTQRGLTLFERLRAKDWLGFLRAPTHRSWSDRVAQLRTLPASSCPVVRP